MIHEIDMKLKKKLFACVLNGTNVFILVSVSVQWFALPQREKINHCRGVKTTNKQTKTNKNRTNKQTNKQNRGERVSRNQGKVRVIQKNYFLLNCFELKDVCLLFAFSHVHESTSFCD